MRCFKEMSKMEKIGAEMLLIKEGWSRCNMFSAIQKFEDIDAWTKNGITVSKNALWFDEDYFKVEMKEVNGKTGR